MGVSGSNFIERSSTNRSTLPTLRDRDGRFRVRVGDYALLRPEILYFQARVRVEDNTWGWSLLCVRVHV